MAAPSAQELYDLGRAEAILRRPDLSVLPGDVSDMLLWGAVAMADRAIGYAAERFRATYLDGARGGDLEELAEDHYGLTRTPAVKATGSVTITRASGTGAATYPVGTVVATQRDALGEEVRFVTTQAAAWTSGTPNGAQTVTVAAANAGPAGNVAAGKVTRILDPAPASGTFSVTNAAVMVGGAEAESDEDLRARCRAYLLTLRRGTLSALEYGALQVASVKKASAVEDATGLVTVYVTDAAGNSSAEMTAAVTDELEQWRCAGSAVQVLGGAVLSIDVTLAITVRAGANSTQLAPLVVAAVTGRINRLRIGESLHPDYIQAAARAVDPDNILAVSVVAPVGVQDPADNQIIRAGTVTVS